MKPEMLQVQQYLNVHPILGKNEGLRKKYVVLLKFFVEKQGRGDLWSKQMLKLYSDKIVGEGFELGKEKTKDLNIIEQFKFFKYRYYLLTDCLFIRYFDDKKKGQKIVEDIIEFYGERYRKKLEIVYEAFYSTESDSFLKSFAELKDVYTIIWNNRSFKAQPLKKIMITANMSAGKSTLLNALAGKKINKTQGEACTAKLHYLYNKAGEDGLNYELDHDLELDASVETLMTDNSENDSTDIIVGTRFRSIGEIDAHICIIDTPGVNSAMNKSHRKITNEAIKNVDCDLMIYLINGEEPARDDDIKHLKYVKNNYDGDIIFLVNRLDRYRKNEGSVKNTLNNIVGDLEKVGFQKPVVYPVSAYAGYLGKMALFSESLSEDELDELDFVKRKLKKDDYSYDKFYPLTIVEGASSDELEELLLHSGILSLEKIIYQ
ncbi:dynamin family protein [Butyrivibrio sp. MC2013]|uniref:dynamin family protein n=1 Tax=Butyrivibrio sp. MC2013 TaxID=1280686 RepID=UPI0003FCFFE1|nr:dynamin family protein [Butyrivibrio sp. MC2013]